MSTHTFLAIIHKEDDTYVALCPEIGTASQGKTIEDAVANLREATELYLEEDPSALREHSFVTVTTFSATAADPSGRVVQAGA